MTLETTLRNELEPFKAEWFTKMENWANEHFNKVLAIYTEKETRINKMRYIIGEASVNFRMAHSNLFNNVFKASLKENKEMEKYIWMRAWKNHKDEWLARFAKDIAEEWEANVKTLVKKCTKYGIDENAIKVVFKGVTAKGFDVNLTDGKNRIIKARMIWAAEFSVLVRPHVRYIVTEKKIK